VIFVTHVETYRIVAYTTFWIMMLIVFCISTLYVNPSNIQSSTLKQTFGFNNICIYFDFQPSLTFAAMFWVIPEAAFNLYIIFNFLTFYFLYKSSKLPRWQLIVTMISSPIQLTAISVFRLVFVEHEPDNLELHSWPFLFLQLGILLIALQNLWYYNAADLHKGHKIVNYVFVVGSLIITFIYQLNTISIFSGNPVWCSTGPDCQAGAAAAHAFDTLWFLSGSVLPVFYAFYFRSKNPALKFTITTTHGADAKDRFETIVQTTHANAMEIV